MSGTIPGVLRSAAERYSDTTAYVEGDASLSFGALLERVRRTAAGYREIGLAPGDRVVVWAPNSIDWVVAALAASYAGGTLVPANSRYTGPEVAELVDRTGAVIVVVADGFLGRNQIADLRAASELSSVRRVLDVARLYEVETEPGDNDAVENGRAECGERVWCAAVAVS